MTEDDPQEGEMLPDIANYSKIEGSLFLGNLTAALDTTTLKELHISHILTVDSKPLPSEISRIPGLHLCYIKANDMSDEDLLSHFPRIVNFISDGQHKGNVLVHCYFGVSRSACAVVAYLMKKYNLKVDEALERVKLKRKCIGPNSGFLSQLVLYQNLGYETDPCNNSFKLYRLTVAGNAFRRGKFSCEEFSDIIFQNPGYRSLVDVKCRNCRRILLSDLSIIPHLSGQTPKWFASQPNIDPALNCSLGIFSTPCEWITNICSPQGKLYCPKCRQKVGSFNWMKGSSCPCNVILCPGFIFTRSKVDVCRTGNLPGATTDSTYG